MLPYYWYLLKVLIFLGHLTRLLLAVFTKQVVSPLQQVLPAAGNGVIDAVAADKN